MVTGSDVLSSICTWISNGPCDANGNATGSDYQLGQPLLRLVVLFGLARVELILLAFLLGGVCLVLQPFEDLDTQLDGFLFLVRVTSALTSSSVGEAIEGCWCSRADNWRWKPCLVDFNNPRAPSESSESSESPHRHWAVTKRALGLVQRPKCC